MLERRKFVSRYDQITGYEPPPHRWNLHYGDEPQPITQPSGEDGTEAPKVLHLQGEIKCGAAAAPRDLWAEHEQAHRIVFDGSQTINVGENTYSKSAALEHLTHALTESVELFKQEVKRKRHASPPLHAMPKWFIDLLTWCRDRGMKTDDDTIAAWLKVTRQTVWGWKQGRAPQSHNIEKIIGETKGEIDPRGKRRP